MSSWIFVPGINDKFLDKSEELKASSIIFDLEDSVLPEDKTKAIHKVNNTLQCFNGDAKKYVRVNSVKSAFFVKDLSQLIFHNIDGIIIPKIESRDELIIADYLLSGIERDHSIPENSISVIPLIESAKGVYNIREISASVERIEALAFGSEDYKTELNIKEDDCDSMRLARATLVIASSEAIINPPIDGIYTDFNDNEGLKATSRYSKNSGFQGRLVIHPKQLEVVNTEYQPTVNEIKEAEAIVKAFEASKKNGLGAISVEGKMVDPPVAYRAKKLLENL